MIRVRPFSVSFWIFLLALLLLTPCNARAQASPCLPGKDCVVGSHTVQPIPRYRFPTCTRSLYGRQYMDGDAGQLNVCQRDGGYAVIGPGSSSGSSGFFYDAGAGRIYAQEALRNPDAGVGLVIESNRETGGLLTAPGDALRLVHQDPFSDGWPNIVFAKTQSSGVLGQISASSSAGSGSGSTRYAGLNFSAANIGFVGDAYGGSALIGYFDGSNKKLVMETPASSDAIVLTAGAQINLGGSNLVTTSSSGLEMRGGISAGTADSTHAAIRLRALNALDTGDPIMVACHGAGCTYDFVVPYSAPAQAINGIVIGDAATQSPILGSVRGTLVNPPSCTTATTTDTAMTFSTAPAAGSECVVGVPGVALQTGLTVSCFMGASNVLFRCRNSTGGGLTPPAGTYSCRCFAP